MPPKLLCKTCPAKFFKKDIITHQNTCIVSTNKHKSGYLIRFVSYGQNNNQYYMYALFDASSTFSDIDIFLKEMWVECCGHLSGFSNLNSQIKIKNSTLISKYPNQSTFLYEYDYGSTTQVFFEFIEILNLNKKTKTKQPIELLLRNDPPYIKCYSCDKNSVFYYEDMSFCREDSYGFYLEKPKEIKETKVIKKTKEPKEIRIQKEYLLPILNSPRSGVCGYGRDANLDEDEYSGDDCEDDNLGGNPDEDQFEELDEDDIIEIERLEKIKELKKKKIIKL
jgi:hypothetical protein